MGACSSSPKKESIEILGVDSVDGLLPLDNLDTTGCKVGNLVFADGGAKAFAYIGALKVLEFLGVMNDIRRFAGVGTGALIAAPLAIGLHSDSVQKFFRQCLNSFEMEEVCNSREQYLQIRSCFGMMSGHHLMERFNKLLKSKGFPATLTFGQLHIRTGIELCIIVSNLTNCTIEYCHPKTTPNLPLSQALLMSLSVPGIFTPHKFRVVTEECHYLGGNLICSYPINAYDGWRLSMDDRDIFRNPQHAAKTRERSDTYFQRNPYSLGLVLLDRLQESNYPELGERLKRLSSDERVPSTRLGRTYKEVQNLLHSNEKQYLLVREAGFKIMRLLGQIDENIIDELEFSEKIIKDQVLDLEEMTALFGAPVNNVEECHKAIKKLNENNAIMHKSDLSARVETVMLLSLRQYYDTGIPRITSLNTFFGALSNTVESSSFEMAEEDFDRTVGIMCKYVCSFNVTLERDDLCFLFRQGWNSTVAYFRFRREPEPARSERSDSSIDFMVDELGASSFSSLSVASN